jgi:hypothetical protein
MRFPFVDGVESHMPYVNYRGEKAWRRFIPVMLWYGSTPWHPEPQWLLTARDVEKNEMRDFALSGFISAMELP